MEFDLCEVGYDTHTLYPSLYLSLSFFCVSFFLCLCLSFDSFIMINYLHARNNMRILLSLSRYLPEDNSVHAMARIGKGLEQQLEGKSSYLLCNGWSLTAVENSLEKGWERQPGETKGSLLIRAPARSLIQWRPWTVRSCGREWNIKQSSLLQPSRGESAWSWDSTQLTRS